MTIPATDKRFFVDVESALFVFRTLFGFSGNLHTSAVWTIRFVLETDTFQKFNKMWYCLQPATIVLHLNWGNLSLTIYY